MTSAQSSVLMTSRVHSAVDCAYENAENARTRRVTALIVMLLTENGRILVRRVVLRKSWRGQDTNMQRMFRTSIEHVIEARVDFD